MVGTSSGSTYTCNAGKNGIKSLENSSIQLYFGRSSFATAVEGMDKAKPIEPDYNVTETYQNYLDGKDVVLEEAMSIITRPYF